MIGALIELSASHAPPHDDDYWYTPYFHDSTSGIEVTEDVMMSSTAVLQAVRLNAEMVASQALVLHEHGEEEGRATVREAKDHPLYDTFRFRPNPLMTSFQFLRMLSAQRLIRGNFYAHMLPLQNGGMEFWPMIHDRVKIVTKGARDIAYEYRPPQGQPITIPREQVLHFSGFSIEGFMGRGIRRDGIDAIGRLKGTETYGASFLKNGASPGGALRHPKRVSPEARSNMRRDWEATHGGAAKAHTLAILEEGVEWVQTGVAPKDAQMLETMQFQVLEIARLTNTPPHLLMDLSKINIANVAELARQWLIFSQGPVLRDIEMVFRTMCFPRTEWRKYSVDFDTEQIQRPDMKTFYESLNTATGRPFMSVNEARARAGMGPVDNGDDILQPLNMGNPGGDPEAPNEPVAPPPAEEIEIE